MGTFVSVASAWQSYKRSLSFARRAQVCYRREWIQYQTLGHVRKLRLYFAGAAARCTLLLLLLLLLMLMMMMFLLRLLLLRPPSATVTTAVSCSSALNQQQAPTSRTFRPAAKHVCLSAGSIFFFGSDVRRDAQRSSAQGGTGSIRQDCEYHLHNLHVVGGSTVNCMNHGLSFGAFVLAELLFGQLRSFPGPIDASTGGACRATSRVLSSGSGRNLHLWLTPWSGLS